LAALDYYILPNLKKRLKGRQFYSTKEETLAADMDCSTTERIFLGWVKEFKTTKS
jgi:hypothetical protein